MEPKNIKIELPIATWNVVLESLYSMPYAKVSDIIPEIRKQAEYQISKISASTSQENN